METNGEYLEESCWADGECSNECEQCNNITDRCCVSCESRVGCFYLCQLAKLQQEHERKSDDELIALFGDWSEQDGRFLYAEDRVRALSGKLAAAQTELAAEKTRSQSFKDLSDEQFALTDKILATAEGFEKEIESLKQFIKITSDEEREWLEGLGIEVVCGWRNAVTDRLKQAEARGAVLLKAYCGECDFDPEICRGTEPEIECAARVMDGTPEADLLAEHDELRKAVTWMKTTAEFFRYKAPEQIDGCRLIAAMAATAKAALKEVPPCSE